MGEVVNLSLSQRANHVLTHLYNNQESHIPYKKNQPVNFFNNVFLSTSKTHTGHTNYAPRALVFDLRYGLGSLNKHEYHETPTNFDNIPQSDRFNLDKQIAKNQYQQNLDKGIASTEAESILSVENTKFWTDYNKLIYSPSSLNTLQNYDIGQSPEYGSHHNFPQIKFNTFEVGQKEFSDSTSNLDSQLDSFRRLLEQCDLLQGVNVVSELDSAWGGFTTLLLTEFIDEYFNGGISNTKNSIWIYGLHSQGPSGRSSINEAISRIKTTIELSKNSTLFFPINTAPFSKGIFSSEYEDASLWHSGAVTSLFINSLWGLNNQVDNSVSMSTIEDNILRGEHERKIVNDIKLKSIDSSKVTDINSLGSIISNVDISAYYNMSAPKPQDSSSGYIDLSVPTTVPTKTSSKVINEYFVKNYVIPTEQGKLEEKFAFKDKGIPSNVYRSRDITSIIKVDTFPYKIFNLQKQFNFYSEFNVSTDYRIELKAYKDLIKNVRLNSQQLMGIIEDKAELIEDISHILEHYTISNEPSDEELDDDY